MIVFEMVSLIGERYYDYISETAEDRFKILKFKCNMYSSFSNLVEITEKKWLLKKKKSLVSNFWHTFFDQKIVYDFAITTQQKSKSGSKIFYFKDCFYNSS